MRTSQSSTRGRLVRAGLAAAAATAAVVAGTASPAFAADVDITTVSPLTTEVGGGNTLTFTGTNVLLNITTPGGRFTPIANNCPATYGTTSASNLAAVTERTNDNSGTVVVPTLVSLGNYRLCVYAGTAGTSAIAGHSLNANPIVLSKPTLSLNKASGTTAGGPVEVRSTAGGAYLNNVTAVSALFTTAGSCPATYNATGNIVVPAAKTSANVATLTVPANMTSGTVYKVCLYPGTTGTSALINGTSAATYVTLPGLTLSPTVGPTGGTNTITATTSTNVFGAFATPGVMVAKDRLCPATYGAVTGAVVAAGVQKISNTKIVFTVPASTTLDLNAATTPYNVCIYANASNGQLAATSAVYTVAPALTVTSISPAGGPAQGGSEVTISGTGFPYPADEDTVVSASLGGSPLTDLKVESDTSITGVTTAHTAGNATVSVTTAAGTKSGPAPFVYSYGITVTPKTAPTNTQVYVDVQGVGFSDITWGTGNPVSTVVGPGVGNGRVFLVNDAYDPTEEAGATGNWENAPVTVCGSILPIDDNEIICQMNLGVTYLAAGTGVTAATPVPNGTYQITVVSDATPGELPADANPSIISSGSTFTVAPY